MRFLDETLKVIQHRAEDNEYWMMMRKELDSVKTKRVLFDSRQASVFAHLGDSPPGHVRNNLVWPFEQFFLEFTEGITFGDPIPMVDRGNIRGAVGTWSDEVDKSNNTLRAFFVGRSVREKFNEEWLTLSPVSLFFPTGDDWPRTATLDVRGFYYHLFTGRVFTRRQTMAHFGEGSRDSSGIVELNAEVMEGYADIGKLWVMNVLRYRDLLSWLLTYMSARGVEIREEQVSRQQRRQLERSKMPKPWHVVTISSKLIKSIGDEGLVPVNHHRFRYDVMGHLRFGRHKLKSGDYRHTIEVVRPHQRGLGNELYIPKVSKFVAEVSSG